MVRKRKVFLHPKALQLKFEEGELAAIDARLQEERQSRPFLTRAELLREWILIRVRRVEEPLSDRPIPCRWCGRLFPEHLLKTVGGHEDKCGQNPKWKDRGMKPTPLQEEIVQFRRWLEDKFVNLDARFSTKVDILEQFLFRGRFWGSLNLEEQEKLLRFFLNPAIGAAPRQFRPVQFKEYLARLEVATSLAPVPGRQDEIALFLQAQNGKSVARNDRGFYTALPSPR